MKMIEEIALHASFIQSNVFSISYKTNDFIILVRVDYLLLARN